MTQNQDQQDLREKTSHLRQILKDARKNPREIPPDGRVIFSFDDRILDEEYALRVCLNENGEPYFLANGSYCERVSSSRPTRVLSEGQRYLPISPLDFKKEVR